MEIKTFSERSLEIQADITSRINFAFVRNSYSSNKTQSLRLVSALDSSFDGVARSVSKETPLVSFKKENFASLGLGFFLLDLQSYIRISKTCSLSPNTLGLNNNSKFVSKYRIFCLSQSFG